ncbi:MAG: hypothetical protein J6X30_00725 [Clostridia bacterium]|nr:hypothetical protein [Clostridia bacterium]
MNSIRSFTHKALCVLLLFSCLTACRTTPEAPITIPSVNDTAQTTRTALTGGTLRVPINADPYSLHPLYVRELQTRNVFSMIFEPLLAFQDNGEPAPCLAESWKQENGVWVLSLRPNVHWHGDLGEMTGQDAAWTINTVLADPASIYYTTLSYYIERADGYDNTLLLYPRVNSYALLYALNIPVIPQSYYEGKSQTTRDIPRGSGCFCVDSLSFDPAMHMSLTAFSKWWKKLPHLEGVEAIGYTDTKSMLDDFSLKSLDCVPTSLKTTDPYEILDHVNSVNYLSYNYVFLAFNLQNAFLRNSGLRKALAYSIDRSEIIQNVYLTKATGAEQPLFHDSSLTSASVTQYDHNITLAKSLLTQSGFTDQNGDGMIDGVLLRLAVIQNTENPLRLKAAETLQAQFEKAGVRVSVTAYSENDLKACIARGDYDLLLTGSALSDAPNLAFLFQDGPTNFSHYSSAAADEIFARRPATFDELKSMMLALQNLLAEDLPQIGLFMEMNTFLYRDDLIVPAIRRETTVYRSVNTWYFVAGE